MGKGLLTDRQIAARLHKPTLIVSQNEESGLRMAHMLFVGKVCVDHVGVIRAW